MTKKTIKIEVECHICGEVFGIESDDEKTIMDLSDEATCRSCLLQNREGKKGRRSEKQ